MSTPKERRELEKLASYLDDQGFPGMSESIEEYISTGAAGWRSVGEFLNTLRQDVWWNYGHVGEEEERHIFEAAEQRIWKTQAELY